MKRCVGERTTGTRVASCWWCLGPWDRRIRIEGSSLSLACAMCRAEHVWSTQGIIQVLRRACLGQTQMVRHAAGGARAVGPRGRRRPRRDARWDTKGGGATTDSREVRPVGRRRRGGAADLRSGTRYQRYLAGALGYRKGHPTPQRAGPQPPPFIGSRRGVAGPPLVRAFPPLHRPRRIDRGLVGWMTAREGWR